MYYIMRENLIWRGFNSISEASGECTNHTTLATMCELSNLMHTHVVDFETSDLLKVT